MPRCEAGRCLAASLGWVLGAFAPETPSGGLGVGVQRSSPCLAQHVDGITPRKQVVCKVVVMQIAAIWQLTTWGTAEAGNRAGKTGRYLQWWDNGPECLAMTSGVCKVHHNTLLRRARPLQPASRLRSQRRKHRGQKARQLHRCLWEVKA